MNDFKIFGLDLEGVFNDMFESLDNDFFGLNPNCKTLRMNVLDNIVTFEVPGLKEDQIDVSYKNGVLSITADWGEKKEGRTGKYSNSYRVPDIDSEKIDAKLESGLLTLTLPKSDNTKTKKIKINKS